MGRGTRGNPTDDSQRIRVGGKVEAAALVHQVAPIYPQLAKQAHISGTVVLHCVIAKDGSVQQLEYVSGPPLLLKSAMDAVRQWVYKPTLVNGKAREVDTTVTVVFTLGDDGEESNHGTTGVSGGFGGGSFHAEPKSKST